MKPYKIAVSTIAIFVVFALTVLLESGHFLLPFGLFKPTFILLVAISLFFNKKRLIFSDWILIGWAFLLSFSSKFFLDILLSQRVISEYIDAILALVSLANIVAFLLLLLWMISIVWKQEVKAQIIQVMGALGMFICFYADYYVLLIIPTIVWFTGSLLTKQKNETYSGISLFLFFVIVSSWISACIYGAPAILSQL